MPPIDLNALNGVRKDLEAAQAEQDRLAQGIAAQSAEMARLDAEAARLAAAGDSAGARAQADARQRAAAQRQAAAARQRELEDALRDIAGRLGPLLDPCDADPSVPLLLLPVRLETRYTPDRSSLRVRIFPDDIHIDQLDRGLSDTEQEAGREYWNAVWRASEEDAGTAWRTLVERAGARRAAWTAIALTPENLAARQDEASPRFGPVTQRVKSAAVARLLPDVFNAVAIQGGQASAATGRPIAPSVIVGLYADDGSELKDVNGVKVTAGAEWLVDYAEAERVGLAVTVPLKQPGAAIDQLFVFGVRRSMDPAKVPAELESLFLGHRCTRGLAFVPQGAPTNNTESTRAEWQRRTDPQAPPRDPATDPAADTNAAVLAAALGIDPSALAGIEHAGDREQALARAANIALWGPAWGTFLDRLTAADNDGRKLTDPVREDVRVFHRDHVRARGPLPALRVGNQPYGVLPVSNLERLWHSSDSFEDGLLQRLKRLRAMWRAVIPSLPRVGSGPIDQTMQDLLGASPVCVGLRVRPVLSSGMAQIAAPLTGADQKDLDLERLIDEMVWEEFVAIAGLTWPSGSLATKSRPLSLPLVDDKNDGAVIGQILAGGSPALTSVLQALVKLAWDRAALEVRNASADGRFAEVVAAATTIPADARERVLGLATRADLPDAATLASEESNVRRAAGLEVSPTLADFQPVAATRSSFSELALSSTNDAARQQLSTFGVLHWLGAGARLAELRDALTVLAQAPLPGAIPEERKILVAETLDLASHRLDAWLTAIVDRRLKSLRAAKPAGLSIGAYGWVENIAPAADPRGDGGYVFAPSPAHATTAGILRAAYLAHNGDSGGSGAFAVDLSSARVRTALHLAEGVRSGQPLSALLGYRIERGIHDAGVDRLILSLRAIAPLKQGKLSDRGDAVTPEAVEAIAAANIVDGIDLVEKYQGKVAGWGPAAVRAALAAAPRDNPYLTGAWPALTDDEWRSITAVLDDAAAALDAASDLLLAESVHHIAQGNVPRASAALDAASSGDSVPPEPEVISSRREGTPLGHRLLIVAGGGAAWNASRPRAKAAPGLESWAATRLGDPATILVADGANGGRKTVADTGLCALDLVYGAGNRAAFEQSLRAALTDLPPDAAFFDGPAEGWAAGERSIGDVFELASSLRALLVNARPASPLDLAVPNADSLRAVTAAELDAVHQRVQDAADALAVRGQGLEALVAGNASDAAIAAALDQLAAFGVAAPPVKGESLATVARWALAEAHRRVVAADGALGVSPPTSDSVIAGGQAVFGDGFWTAPAIAAPAASDAWQASLQPGAISAPPAAIRRHLADAASVRDGARRYSEMLMLCEAAGVPPTLFVAQPAGVGTVAPAAWIGEELDPAQPTPDATVVSVVVDASGPYDGGGETLALVVDDWVEVLPVRERRGEGADTVIDERVTAGVTFNAMAASARPPQAMLLAVSPDAQRWTSDAVLDLLQDVLELARLRAVTLERTNGIARVLPALYEQSWSLQGESVIDFRYVSEKAMRLDAIPPYVKEQP